MAIPTDGLVFYAPLAESKTTAETGENIEEYNAEFTTKNGVHCFHSTQNGYLKIKNLEAFRNAYNAGTFCCSFFGMYESGASRTGFTFIGSSNRSTNPLAAGFTRLAQADTIIWNNSNYQNKMVHVLFNVSNYNLEVYVNGQKEDQSTIQRDTINTPSIASTNALTIGALPDNWDINNSPGSEKYIGYICALRFYNKKLNESEIQELANEFNEDSGGSDSGNTGFLIDGLFLSSSKPKPGQKGLLLDNKYFLPLVEGGGSAEYYKCASVDTSAKTWTGYRAVLNDGVYTFEDTVTSGLSYTSVTPQVGKIYNAACLVHVSSLYGAIPTEGLVFYAPLSENKTEAETGQTMNFSGTVVYDMFSGINGAFFKNVYFSSSIGSTLSEWTLSFWIKVLDGQMIGAGYFNAIPSSGETLIYVHNATRELRFYPPDDLGTDVAPENWNHIMVASSGNICSVYQNGIFHSNKTWDKAKSFDKFYIGTRYSKGTMKAYTAGLRIYNRLLSEMEAASLASEFTPTQVNT